MNNLHIGQNYVNKYIIVHQNNEALEYPELNIKYPEIKLKNSWRSRMFFVLFTYSKYIS